jgi:hypothetical protein
MELDIAGIGFTKDLVVLILALSVLFILSIRSLRKNSEIYKIYGKSSDNVSKHHIQSVSYTNIHDI